MNRRDIDPRRSDGDQASAQAVRPREESFARVPVRDDDVDADVDARESMPRDDDDGVDRTPRVASRRSEMPADAPSVEGAPQQHQLLSGESLAGYRSRWERVQIGFVDEPRTAVRDAEALVNEMVKELTDVFTRERRDLERSWSSGTDVSTEDMRVALQRYRSFFQRLLAM